MRAGFPPIEDDLEFALIRIAEAVHRVHRASDAALNREQSADLALACSALLSAQRTIAALLDVQQPSTLEDAESEPVSQVRAAEQATGVVTSERARARG